jgi:hypothetical protein
MVRYSEVETPLSEILISIGDHIEKEDERKNPNPQFLNRPRSDREGRYFGTECHVHLINQR